MSKIDKALSAFFEREAIAMAKPQGANHAELLEQIASEFELETDVLTEAMLDASIMGPN